MDGGFHGAFDQTGRLVEAGWAACGYDQTTTPEPDRTWAALDAS